MKNAVLILPSHKSSEISFKVGIAGTQTLPSTVCVILERDGKSVSYNATQSNDSWIANIDNPGIVFSPGEVKLSVSVLINNRLFVPLKSIAVIEVNQQEMIDQPEIAVQPTVQPEEVITQPHVESVAKETIKSTQEIIPDAVQENVSDVREETPVQSEISVDPILENVKKVAKEERERRAKEILNDAKAKTIAEKKMVKPIRTRLLPAIEPKVENIVYDITNEKVQEVTKSKKMFTLKKIKVVYI